MKKLKVAVLISGRGSNLQALIDAVKQPDFPAEIVAVISNKADAYGLVRAKEAGIATYAISHKEYPTRELFDAALHQQLLAVGAELVCLAGFMRIITEDFVNSWQNRMINIHPSLLPSFKGLHAQQQAIDAGVRLSGCTVHFVTPEMDAGPIILQAIVPVHANDTVEALEARILPMEHKAYPLAVRWIAEGRISVKEGKTLISGISQPAGLLSGF